MKILTHSWHQAHGATFEDFAGCEIPSHYGKTESEYRALRDTAGVRDVSFFGKTRMSGRDRHRFLNGMISNEVKGLVPGKGVWALFLDIKGHVQADMKVYALPDQFLIVTQHYVRERLVQGLDRYIISEDVQMQDVTGEYGLFQIIGPDAESLLRSHGAKSLPDSFLSFIEVEIAGKQARLIRMASGYTLLCSGADAPAVLDALDAPKVGQRAFDVYRIESGMALIDIDVQESNFPQECRWDDALNFKKGCYLGQEVMARIDAQGHVNRFLMGLSLSSTVNPGDKIYKNQKEVGKVTSTAHSPILNTPFAIGYVRRELARDGEEVQVGEKGTLGIVKQLPLK